MLQAADCGHGCGQVDFHEHSKKTKARARDTRKQLKKRKALAKKAQQEKVRPHWLSV